MKKFAYFIIIIIILAGGYYFYAQKNKQAMAPTVENGGMTENKAGENQNQPLATSSLPNSPSQGQGSSTQPSQGTFSGGEGDSMAPDILVVQVDFDGQSFNPKSVNIKVGDIVIFKNNSSQDFWPASNPHPIHTDYPEFDAKQAIAPGGKYQFKFEKAGNWGYHDHLNPSMNGTINVSSK